MVDCPKIAPKNKKIERIIPLKKHEKRAKTSVFCSFLPYFGRGDGVRTLPKSQKNLENKGVFASSPKIAPLFQSLALLYIIRPGEYLFKSRFPLGLWTPGRTPISLTSFLGARAPSSNSTLVRRLAVALSRARVSLRHAHLFFYTIL